MSIPCAIYVRISRDPHDKRKGVERQKADCQRAAAELGWTVARIFDENNQSATKGTRGVYGDLLEAIRSGEIKGLISWQHDRTTRSVRETEDLLDLHDQLGLRIADPASGELNLSSPKGRRDFRNAGVSAKGETENLSYRLKRAFDDKALTGERHGSPAYGWRRIYQYAENGMARSFTEELHPEQAEVIRRVAGELCAGLLLRTIVRTLNAEGVPAPRAAAWSATSLRSVMLRPANAGRRVHRGKVVEGVAASWPAIYSGETHDRVVALLTDPARRTSERGTARRHLLTGIVRCGKCGAAMYTGSGGGKYSCVACNGLARKIVPVDEYVEALMIGRLQQPDVMKALAGGDAAAVEAAQTTRALLQDRLAEAAGLFADGTIDAGQLAKITGELRTKIAAAETELAAALPAAVPLNIVGEHARELWEAAELDGKRALIDRLMVVTVLPIGRGNRPAAADGLRIEWR